MATIEEWAVIAHDPELWTEEAQEFYKTQSVFGCLNCNNLVFDTFTNPEKPVWTHVFETMLGTCDDPQPMQDFDIEDEPQVYYEYANTVWEMMTTGNPLYVNPMNYKFQKGLFGR